MFLEPLWPRTCQGCRPASRRVAWALLSLTLALPLAACADGLVPSLPGDVEAAVDRASYQRADTILASVWNHGGATVRVSPYVGIRRRSEAGWDETAALVTGPGGAGAITWVRLPLEAGHRSVDTIPVAWLGGVNGEFRIEYAVTFSDGQDLRVATPSFVLGDGP